MSNHQTTTPSTASEPSDSLNDVSRYIPIVQNPDGSITRIDELPKIAADSDPNSTSSVLTKDFPLNPHYHTWLRAFLPRKAPDSSSSAAADPKLPLIVYFHGGGFIVGSAASSVFHTFCVEMAVQVGAMVVSVDYRLAPEHRLPAAYDDAIEALHWIRSSDDEWFRDFTDISICFLMGTNAGGNIAYRAGLCAATFDDVFPPLKIRGLILHQPYFGGIDRTASELRLVNDRTLPLFVNDLMWELALPKMFADDRNHGYSNPTVDPGRISFHRMVGLGWKVMVTGCDGDPLIDRQKELASVLEEKGVITISWFVKGGFHGVDLLDPTKARAFLEMLEKSFVYPIVAVS